MAVYLDFSLYIYETSLTGGVTSLWFDPPPDISYYIGLMRGSRKFSVFFFGGGGEFLRLFELAWGGGGWCLRYNGFMRGSRTFFRVFFSHAYLSGGGGGV